MDIYDREVARLTAAPQKIGSAWSGNMYGKISPLFQFCNYSGKPNYAEKHGCLTQIRKKTRYYKAATSALTLAIIADDRIPDHQDDISPTDLPVFAEWQRRLDKELGRTPPEDWTP